MASLPEGISLDIPDLVVSIEPRSEYIVTLQPVDEYRTVTLTTPITTRATSIFVDRAQSASFSQTAITASYFDTDLTVESASFANLAATASYIETAKTASFVASASYSETASYSNTSEWDGLNSIPAGIISSSTQLPSGIISSSLFSSITSSGGISASGDITAETFVGTFSGALSSSAFSSPSQGTVRAIINGATTDVDTGLQTGDSPQFTNLTVSGDLTVNGSTTYLSSSQVDIGDRILTLNANNAVGDGGLYVHDIDTNETGSLLWDVSEDKWIGGLKDSESELMTLSSINTKGVISSSAQFKTLTAPFTGSYTGSFVGDGSDLTGLVSSSYSTTASYSNTGEYSGLNSIPAGIVSSSTQLPSGIISSSTQLPSGTVSASSQVDHDATTNFVANEHIDHSSVSVTAGDGLTGGGTIASTRTINVVGGDGITANANDIEVDATVLRTTANSVISSSAQFTSSTAPFTGSFTGSFTGDGSGLNLGGLSVTSASFATTASYVDVSGQTVGSASFATTASYSNVSEYSGLNGVPTGIVSSSTQLPSNIVSASSQVDHDATTNFVANEHIDHSGVSITAGDGLTGGGTIAATRTVNVVGGDGITANANDIQVDATVLRTTGNAIISSSAQFTSSTAPFTGSFQGDGSQLTLGGTAIVSASSQVDHDATTNFVANEHIDHSGVTITAGTGLTGGGTIAATRTINVAGGDGITANADDIEVDATVLRTTAYSVVSSSAQFTSSTAPFTGSFQGDGSQLTLGGTAIVSASSQVDHDATTNFVANEHIDHSGVSVTAGDGLTGGGTIASTRTINVVGGDGITANTNDIEVDATVLRTTGNAIISSSAQFTSSTAPFTGSFSGSAFAGDGSDLTGLVSSSYSTTASYSHRSEWNALNSKPSGIVSASSQVDHDATTNFVANEHIDHSGVSITAGDGLTGGGTIASTRTINVVGGDGITANANDIEVDATVLRTTGNSVISSSAQLPSGIISSSAFSSPSQGTVRSIINGATTNVDTGLQTGDSPEFTNLTLSGNLTVNGTTTYISSSEVDIGDRIVTLNANNASGDGGLYVHDIDTNETGSLLWDVSEDKWIGGLKDSESELMTLSSINAKGVISSSTQLPANIVSASSQVDHDATTNFVANEHIDHSGVSITAGAGLTGGGTIAATRTVNVVGGDGITANANDIEVDATVLRTTAYSVVSSSAQFTSSTAPFTGSFSGSAFAGDGSDLTGLVSSSYSITSSHAAVAKAVTISDNESTNEDNAIVFAAGADVDGGNIGLESDGNLTYNPSTGKVTATQLAGTVVTATQGTIDHDSLANFVANEHIDHSGVTITAGTGLTGGGTIAATRTLNVAGGDGITANADDIEVDATVLRTTGNAIISSSAQFTSSTAPFTGSFQGDGSQLTLGGTAIVSASSQVDHDSTTNFVANEHIDHSGVSVTAGDGLTGGGTIAATRTINVVGGDGITANANDIEVDATVLRTTGNAIISSSAQFTSSAAPFTGSFSGSFTGGFTGGAGTLSSLIVGGDALNVSDGLTVIGGTDASALHFDNASGAERAKLFITDTTLTIDADSDLIFKPNNAESVRMKADGKVGIGTNAPGNHLHVSGAGDQYIQISGRATNMYLGHDSAGSTVYTTGNLLNFYVNSANKMSINNSGYVGIGSLDAASALHLSGSATANARITFSQTGAKLQSTIQQGSSGFAISAAGSQAVKIDTNGSERVVIGSDGTFTVSGSAVFNEGSSDVDFRVEGNGDANALHVNGETDHVGVGTNAARAKFEVYDGTVSAAFDADDLSTWRVMQVRNNIEDATGTAAGIALGGDASDTETAGIVGINTNSTGGVVHLALLTAAGNASSEKMRITSAGDVGINATNKLFLDGAAATGNTYIHESSGDTIRFFTGGTSRFQLQSGGVLVPNNAKLYLDGGGDSFITHESANVLRFFTGGTKDFECSSTNLAVVGELTAGTKTFQIDHPLTSMSASYTLSHASVEGPRADLLYRGTVQLSSGSATINLDQSARMTAGTWALLCRDPQVWVQNETGWTQTRGSVTGNILTITAQDSNCTDNVSWMVVAERNDPTYLASATTDDSGLFRLEREKPEE